MGAWFKSKDNTEITSKLEDLKDSLTEHSTSLISEKSTVVEQNMKLFFESDVKSIINDKHNHLVDLLQKYELETYHEIVYVKKSFNDYKEEQNLKLTALESTLDARYANFRSDYNVFKENTLKQNKVILQTIIGISIFFLALFISLFLKVF